MAASLMIITGPPPNTAWNQADPSWGRIGRLGDRPCTAGPRAPGIRSDLVASKTRATIAISKRAGVKPARLPRPLPATWRVFHRRLQQEPACYDSVLFQAARRNASPLD